MRFGRRAADAGSCCFLTAFGFFFAASDAADSSAAFVKVLQQMILFILLAKFTVFLRILSAWT
jgi:hypothetical protein